MPQTYLTRCRLLVDDLKDLTAELTEIARDTEENISEVEAVLAQHYLKQILESLILATRVGRRTWPSLYPQNPVIDYLSITHRNIYRLPITPDQRCIIKKYLRLIENEIDENRGVPGPRSPSQ